MPSTFFWGNWNREYRVIFYILASLFFLSLGFLWWNYFQGENGIISWEKLQEQKTIETTIHAFRLGPFQLSVPAESYVIFEYLGGSDIHHNHTATNIFLGVLAVAVVFMVALITTLDRFWYFAGTSVFILFFIALRLEVLQIFGIKGLVVPVSILLIYLLASFYFKYFRPGARFAIRVSTFMVLTIGLSVLVIFFSTPAYPLLHLLITAYIPALLLALLFILLIAHEILVAFVHITTNHATADSAKHFTIVSFVYITYVIITCLHEMGVIEWSFIYINIYLLLSLSALLGVWGFRLRQPVYDRIFLMEPFGVILFLALGSICFAAVGQFLGNANDAVLKVVREVTIFAHAGFGIVFMLYFFSNFLVMMGNNIPVYGVLYKPNRMPYFTFRLAGLIATLAFVFYSNWREYVYHATAGFYNYVGDLHVLQGNDLYGQSFYEQSTSRAFQNHRANYALGSLRTARLDLEKAHNNYVRANELRPTEFSLVNEGNMFLWTGKYFDAIQSFSAARKKLPESDIIKNNLGYGFAKIHALDSATKYLNAARSDDRTKSAAEANFFALLASELIPVNTDSTLRLFESDSRAVVANAVALSTLLNQDIKPEQDPLSEKVLDLYSATYLNNYIIQNAKTLDTAFIRKADLLASDSANAPYSEALKAALANAYYYKGNVYKALQIMGELAYRTQNYLGKFNYIMGLWVLEHGDPRYAASAFTFAEAADFKEGKFYRAIALTEMGEWELAENAWDSLAVSDDDAIRTLAAQMKKILNLSYAEALLLSDGEKYQYSRYRLGLRDTLAFNRLVNTFENENYKGQAFLDMSRRFLKADRIIPSILYLNKTSGLQLTNRQLFEEIQHHELALLASRRELRGLANQVNKGVTFQGQHQLQKLLYATLLSEASGDTATARVNYNIIATSNPFFEEGILAASDFFRIMNPGSEKSYDILTEAIYVNAHSIRLLKAYAAEAARKGYDEYAESATQRYRQIEESIR